jgi:AGCS family alanine or glycine:cation symporter
MNNFLEFVDKYIVWYNDYIGGYAVLFMLIPTGLYFIIRLKFLNVWALPHSIRVVSGKYSKKGDTGDVNHFKALTTALSATVGTGNIVGVSLAVYYGGPGAVFWMWVTGFLGMILKYAECTLSLKYRSFNSDDTVAGGPMYYMEKGLKKTLGKGAKVLALVFGGAVVIASMGTGNMAQANSISNALNHTYGIENWITGLVLASLTLIIIIGGLKRIAEVTSLLVPFMAVLYVVSALVVIGANYQNIPHSFYLIFHDAFTGTAATGGFIGSTFIMTMLWGVRRGLFSNEAGQGSAPIAHAAAKTEYPVREGLVASLEPLIDTLIICTLTALLIIDTGAWQTGIQGVGMTVTAMNSGLSRLGLPDIGNHIVTIGLFLFAFSTIIAWSYYGATASIYLLGEKSRRTYQMVFGIFVFLGSIWGLDIVWHFVDMAITFMAIPNLIALLLLSPVVIKETNNYFNKMKSLK